jgi:predicted unusual protein kinase regulating ubiquinone biosynthesis (AarF/ABC1/UbiB family)
VNKVNETEPNTFTRRAVRYGRVGATMGGAGLRIAASRLLGGEAGSLAEGQLLAAALGNLKGPLMKVAQLASTIPDLLPSAYASELAQLQAHAPPMGWAFVRRRMAAELGADWQSRFASFSHDAAHAASLGQVHRARAHSGEELACKLQYPDMQSAVEADLTQLDFIFAVYKRMDPVIDTSEIVKEIAARLREELDYEREAKHIHLYTEMLANEPAIRVPQVVDELSTSRLLTMSCACDPQLPRHLPLNGVVETVLRFRRDPRRSSSRQLFSGNRRRGPARGLQSPRLWLHPHFSAEVRRRRGRSLSRTDA